MAQLLCITVRHGAPALLLNSSYASTHPVHALFVGVYFFPDALGFILAYLVFLRNTDLDTC